MIIYPTNNHVVFSEIRDQLLSTPLEVCHLQHLRDLIDERMKAEKYEYHLFSVGDRPRENIRKQFWVLTQALELNGIGTDTAHPVRTDGQIQWTIVQRSSPRYAQAKAMLVLGEIDNTWKVQPVLASDRKQAMYTDVQKANIKALNALSLTAVLFSLKVDISGLGGWKLAS